MSRIEKKKSSLKWWILVIYWYRLQSCLRI